MSSTFQAVTPGEDTPWQLQMLALGDIQALEEIQLRESITRAVVAEYATLYREAAETDPLPPIDVFDTGEKPYILSDGFHRLEAAKAAGRTDLRCHVYQGSKEDARRHGALANLKRGLVYTWYERHQILERFVTDPQMRERSNRDLAQLLSLSNVTVMRAKHRVEALGTLAEAWRALPPPHSKGKARHIEQISTFLELDPEVVTAYEQIGSGVSDRDLLDKLARRMADRNESVETAKEMIGRQMRSAVTRHEQRRQPELTPRQQARREQKDAEWERERREHVLVHGLTSLVELQQGSLSSAAGQQVVVALGDLVHALSPERRQELPALLTQADAVIQQIRELLAQPVAP
jgi:uncharacterized ParB-like nuclease family protein